MHAITILDQVTSFFVRQYVYLKFFRPLTATSRENRPFIVSNHPSSPNSPLFITQSNRIGTLDKDRTTGNPSSPSIPLKSRATDSN